jgi:folate-binding protein YgfZ
LSDVAAEVRAARTHACLFELDRDPYRRGLIAVSGGDAQRWLDGMVTNDITAISQDAENNGCYAALLTPKGRVIADLHVLARPDGFWLETDATVVADVLARLDRYIVADDVVLADRSDDFARLALEGPGATSLLEEACAASLGEVPRDCWASTKIGDTEVVLARFGWTGEEGWQILAAGPAVSPELDAAVSSQLASPLLSLAALEVLRVEAGIPRLGPELDEEVFPDEARLEGAISRTKGCYTGQEIVARLFSRGAVNHLLVGLRFEGGRAPAPDGPLLVGDKTTGEVTSACVSPSAGAIGLGYVRREHAEPGTVLRCDDPDGSLVATVADLPLVAAGR